MQVLFSKNGSTAVLGMWDIDRLGMLSINLKSRRQVAVAEEDNCESQRQTNSDKCEQLKGKLQYTESQNKQDANVANSTVMGNNNKESIASFSEVLISPNLIADAERKDDMTTIGAQIDCNGIDSFLEVLNNQNSITGAETKEDETTIDMQFNNDGTDCIAESIIHSSSVIVKEKEKDDTTTIGAQIDCNSIDFLRDSLISYNSHIIEKETKDTAAQNATTNNNNSESSIVGISTDIGKQAQKTQNNKRK